MEDENSPFNMVTCQVLCIVNRIFVAEKICDEFLTRTESIESL